MTGPYDIIILAGQSNAVGYGHGATDYKLKHLSDVWVLDDDQPEEVFAIQEPWKIRLRQAQDVYTGSLAVRFADEYIKAGNLQPGRKLLIVHCAAGGTGFCKSEWGVGNLLYRRMIDLADYALNLNSENKIVAFLWHQGEHDAFEKNPPENYKKQLFEVISDVRSKYGNMPFIAGDFVNEWKSKNIEICEPIINSIKGVVADLGNSAFVETSDLLSNNQTMNNGDDIHFSRESLHILGERYFETFQKIKQK